jgi:hypothetical protein
MRLGLCGGKDALQEIGKYNANRHSSAWLHVASQLGGLAGERENRGENRSHCKHTVHLGGSWRIRPLGINGISKIKKESHPI